MNGIRSTSGITTGDLTYRYYQGNGQIQYVPANSTSATVLTTVATSASGVIIGIALDLDNRTISWYKNNALLYTATDIVADTYAPCAGAAATTSGGVINFGQRPFAYTPPAGFKSLNTTNIQALGTSVTANAAITPNKYVDVVLSAGNTTGRTVSELEFQPDLVVFKNRDGTSNRRWSWFDSVRGPNAHLTSQNTETETTSQTDLLTSFNSNGFSVGADAAFYGANGFNERWSQWAWRAGNTTVTNTTGNITSQVRANTTAGFSVITYTGNGSGSLTGIGHGLGQAPKFYIIKNRGGATNWFVYHTGLGNTGLSLSTSSAPFANDSYFSSHPSSDRIFVSTNSMVNGNGNGYVAYIWAEIPGFSKISSFTGNGSTDGPFVYCGFRPKIIITKSVTNGAFWVIHDTERDIFNPSTRHLYPHANNAEEQLYSTFDILSNGFKCRNANDNVNYSGSNVVFIAFAESPFGLNNRAR
jgi:hypothetical protein